MHAISLTKKLHAGMRMRGWLNELSIALHTRFNAIAKFCARAHPQSLRPNPRFSSNNLSLCLFSVTTIAIHLLRCIASTLEILLNIYVHWYICITSKAFISIFGRFLEKATGLITMGIIDCDNASISCTLNLNEVSRSLPRVTLVEISMFVQQESY